MIKNFEGFSGKPYLCPAGIPTIGYGTTYYKDGHNVSMSDGEITEEFASSILIDTMEEFISIVNILTRKVVLSQNQFDALVSFAYNLGTGALAGSTLLKKVLANPIDPSIKDEFAKWIYAGKKQVSPGLAVRRASEAALYFNDDNND